MSLLNGGKTFTVGINIKTVWEREPNAISQVKLTKFWSHQDAAKLIVVSQTQFAIVLLARNLHLF